MDDKPERAGSSRGAPTIKDLARAAGVSIGTASKALNGAGIDGLSAYCMSRMD